TCCEKYDVRVTNNYTMRNLKLLAESINDNSAGSKSAPSNGQRGIFSAAKSRVKNMVALMGASNVSDVITNKKTRKCRRNLGILRSWYPSR
ncbi:hypothetical protein RhiirA1_417229, partial [Rhizophagus irregularis]